MRPASGPVTVLILFAAVGAVGTAAEPPSVEGELSVSEKAASITGHFTHQNSTVAFDVERRSAGRVTVEVKTNGQPFDLTYDAATATIKLQGHNGRIFAEGRKALAALSKVLEKRWEPYTSPISLEQHLAFRAILLLSEAPVGHVMEERTLEVPGLPPNVENAPESDGKEDGKNGAELSGESFDQASPCEVDDDDGISHISCSASSGSAWHDACFVHGFAALSELLGCSFAAECVGRCGSGCGFEGAGVYTQDCADHDSCCRVHGGCTDPSDDLCGDEFSEAADDFLVGSTNCSGCSVSTPLPPPPDPEPCSSGSDTTVTYALGIEGPHATARQLDFGLSRVETRIEGSFLMDEWALVSKGAPASVVDSSSQAFGDETASLSDAALGNQQGDEESSLILVVEAGVHPRNTRWIPVPSAPLIETTFPGEPPSEERRIWFRLEMAQEGSIDKVTILNPSTTVERADVLDSIVREFTVRYQGERRHRIVVFGRANLRTDGRLETSELLVTTPLCCCGVDEPHCV